MTDPVTWLLSGDVSLQYLTNRDYLDSDEHLLISLQNRIACEGFRPRSSLAGRWSCICLPTASWLMAA